VEVLSLEPKWSKVINTLFSFHFYQIIFDRGNYYTNSKLNTSQSKLIVPALCRPFFFSGTGHYYNSTRSTCRETRNCATSSCFFRPLEFLLKSGHPDPANSGRGSSFVFRRGAVFCIRRCCRSRCGSLGVDREQWTWCTPPLPSNVLITAAIIRERRCADDSSSGCTLDRLSKSPVIRSVKVVLLWWSVPPRRPSTTQQ
jgi:hypothetical protein